MVGNRRALALVYEAALTADGSLMPDPQEEQAPFTDFPLKRTLGWPLRAVRLLGEELPRGMSVPLAGCAWLYKGGITLRVLSYLGIGAWVVSVSSGGKLCLHLLANRPGRFAANAAPHHDLLGCQQTSPPDRRQTVCFQHWQSWQARLGLLPLPLPALGQPPALQLDWWEREKVIHFFISCPLRSPFSNILEALGSRGKGLLSLPVGKTKLDA